MLAMASSNVGLGQSGLGLGLLNGLGHAAIVKARHSMLEEASLTLNSLLHKQFKLAEEVV